MRQGGHRIHHRLGRTREIIDSKAYLGAFVAFLILDGTWLGVIAKGFYADQLGDRLRRNPNMLVAGVFYLVYVAGIVFLAVEPGLAARAWKTAALHGAVLGFVAYGTYDMTNYATLEGWPVKVVVVDLVWGTLLTAIAATAGFWAAGVGA